MLVVLSGLWKLDLLVMRKDAVWILKMKGTETEGKFGSLEACMQSAYWLTDAAIGETDRDAEAAGSV